MVMIQSFVMSKGYPRTVGAPVKDIALLLLRQGTSARFLPRQSSAEV